MIRKRSRSARAPGDGPIAKLLSRLAESRAVVAAVLLGLGLTGGWVAREWFNGADRPPGPPPEYLYLDSARTLAYLGQIDNGILSSEKRSLSLTRDVGGKVGGGGAEVSAGSGRAQTITQEVTAGNTDRFYRLLGVLDDDRRSGRWMETLDATDPIDAILTKLKEVEVGEFVRIEHGKLYLPPYAAVYPKAAYSARYELEGAEPPLPLEFAGPLTRSQRRAAARYRREVGANPRMPFVLPAENGTRDRADDDVQFVLPVRYEGLTSDPSSLAGEVTVVGKVIFLERSRPRGEPGERAPDAWSDRETVRQFGPALAGAEQELLRVMGLDGLGRRRLDGVVRHSMSFAAPVVVVLPVAIYQ